MERCVSKASSGGALVTDGPTPRQSGGGGPRARAETGGIDGSATRGDDPRSPVGRIPLRAGAGRGYGGDGGLLQRTRRADPGSALRGDGAYRPGGGRPARRVEP